MILVTGGTGFVGSALIPQLVQAGKQVRILLRPSKVTPRLPKGVPVEVAVCSLRDERGLRAAMKGVSSVVHLAGTERLSSRANLTEVDIEGSEAVALAASAAGVQRMLYISHLGADRASAFPVLRAKALAESAIQQSGVPYTIIRSAVLYGPGDQFTTGLARLLRRSPFLVWMPGDGRSVIQPLWIEDLVTAMSIALDDENMAGQTLSLGGGEYFSLRQVLELIMETTGVRRLLVPIPLGYMRRASVWVEQPDRNFPLSLFWLDYLAADRTCPLDNLPRYFGLMPARFHQQIDYLLATDRSASNLV